MSTEFAVSGFIMEKSSMLICEEIWSKTKGVDLLEIADRCVTDNEIDHEKCVGLCTGGDWLMAGSSNSGPST